jgi:solute carrier family 25 (mitochondrial dicarboxylate transporter), member 10
MQGMTRHIIETQGYIAIYNGLSAAVMRQATYSTARFGFYEVAKTHLLNKSNEEKNSGQSAQLAFYQKMFLAGAGGAIGTFVGSPFDLINVRMQNDQKLPPEKRRNYKNCFEAVYRITKQEGFLQLYAGFHMGLVRGILVTIGQIAFYDEFKSQLLRSKYFKDNFFTHFTASMGAGFVATLITMPVDVIKTLLMNAKPGEIKGIIDCVRLVLKSDTFGLFKGFWPRYIRLGPFTILTFIFYEKLKYYHYKVFPNK